MRKEKWNGPCSALNLVLQLDWRCRRDLPSPCCEMIACCGEDKVQLLVLSSTLSVSIIVLITAVHNGEIGFVFLIRATSSLRPHSEGRYGDRVGEELVAIGSMRTDKVGLQSSQLCCFRATLPYAWFACCISTGTFAHSQ